MSGPYVILYRNKGDGLFRAVMDESYELMLFETTVECTIYVLRDVWLSDQPRMIVNLSQLVKL